MSRRIKNTKRPESSFICQRCGKRNYSIMRDPSNQRKNGHIKDLWCIECQMKTKCLEIKENSGYLTLAGWIY